MSDPITEPLRLLQFRLRPDDGYGLVTRRSIVGAMVGLLLSTTCRLNR